ncbi:type II toxin-antitoxin system VapC family toxin [Microvirga aerophila]|uniref:Ribonuclease VapC n=1 Tax=Microvirga aerophila TaxID=670291 RepID=A0A512BWK2_9HYPH|nr:type II toxin-antitoxin system VapC family toxin [Microvirga aerophila]GEO16328.1 ribonuclease VapC [Microvirga aerophila]
MIFVDASALIAIIAGEPDADTLVDLLETELRRLCSALLVWETVAGLCHSHTFSVPAARDHVERFLNVLGCEWISIGEREYQIVLDAYAHYGKGRHPAELNMGNCFACAKSNKAKLLFKGDDFTKTDLARFA